MSELATGNKLMFGFWDGGWGHFTRTMALASEAHSRGHEIGFIASPKYVPEIDAAGFASSVAVIPNRNPDIPAPPYRFPYYSHAFGHSQRQLGLRFNDTEWLQATTDREIQAISSFEPDVIINDYRDTLRTAAQASKVPVVGITHTSGNVHGKSLGWWIQPPVDAKLPDCRESFNVIRRSHGLPDIVDERELFSGDINLIPGIPETDPLLEAAQDSYYIGKLAWHPTKRSFTPLRDDDLRKRVFSYVGESSRPQYGYEAMFTDVILARPNTGFYVVGEQDRYRHLELDNRRALGSVIISNYIPAEEAMQNVDVVLTHGGHETAMIALSHDRPLLCVGPYQTDCSSTFTEIENQGAGILLSHSNQPLTRRKAPDLGTDVDVFGYWHTDLTAQLIGSAMDRIVDNSRYLANAVRLGNSIRALGGASLGIDIVEEYFLR